jgi:3'(2'), 5'-bisphosphate nucleotidase
MLNQINIQDIVNIAKKAGESIMQVYNEDFEVEYKDDNSPLTLADSMANDVIVNSLSELAYKFPILSEEGNEISYDLRKNWDYFWLIDPLDGTKEFIRKNGEFTVNIALIHKDTPVLGVVYAPVLDTCYWAKRGEGAFKNALKLPQKSSSCHKTYKIIASRSHMSKETKAFIDNLKTDKKIEVISIGSSLKICLVAEGEANIYPRLGPTMEWDTGAAHAIVNEVGKVLRTYKNGKYSKHRYNKQNLLNESFVVGDFL